MQNYGISPRTWPGLILAGLLLSAMSSPAAMAQASASLSTPGTTTSGEIGCAPSNNGTGHLVCGQFVGNTFQGVSWQAPAPPGGTLPNKAGVEASGKVDKTNTVALPSGQSEKFAPSCGPADDGTGSAVCMIMAVLSNETTDFYGISVYPPTSATPSPTLSLFSEPSSGTNKLTGTPVSALIGLPSCTAAGAAINGHGVVLCVLTVNSELFAIAFEPFSSTKTALTLLSSSTNYLGNPACAAAGFNTVAMCAIQQGSGLSGFAVSYSAAANSVSLVGSIKALGAASQAFTGSLSGPSCAVPNNVATPNTGTGTYPVTCTIVGSGATPNLFGITFDTQSVLTAYLALGTAPDAEADLGGWGNVISCSAPNVSGTDPTVACAANNLFASPASAAGLYAVKFDPRSGQKGALEGPFSQVPNGLNISCITLAIDANQITCGFTTGNANTDSTDAVNISFDP